MCKLQNETARNWIRRTIICLYFVFAAFAFWIIYSTVKDGFTRRDQLVLVGGLIALVTLPLSLWQIMQHLKHFNTPNLQKPIIRILWMVPIYAVNAWLGLAYPEHILYMDSIRECYEAYVIYNFMKYLLNHLNMEMDLQANLDYKPQVNHFFPFCCLRPWNMATEFLHNCKHGILQYTVVRPVVSVISVICELCGVYGNKVASFSVAYPYMMLIINISQPIAMYCLVLFYRANKEELRPIRPLPKFLCIKAVIFFSFFQGVILDLLVYFGFIKEIFGVSQVEDKSILSEELQNFLLCIEMLLAAIAHHYSFSYHEFQINIPNHGNTRSWTTVLRSMFDISDVHQDVTEHLGAMGSSVSRRFHSRSDYDRMRGDATESQYLINCSNSRDSLSYQNSIRPSTVSSTNNAFPGTSYGTAKPAMPIAPVQQNPSRYSPQHQGAPKSEHMFQGQKSQADTDTESLTNNSNTFRKSDSNNTNSWPSCSDMLNIEVKGMEEDQIRLQNTPKL